MTNFAVFISGRGTNMTAIAGALRRGKMAGRLVFVASDNPDSGGLIMAAKMGIPTEVVDYKALGRKEAEDRLNCLCKEGKVEWIVLAGFMRILSEDFVCSWKGRIVNIHPSLLPSFPGTKAIEEAWKYGVKVTGVTVHLVDEGVDTGPIIAQKAVPLRPGDTMESLEKRIHRVEHQLYWRTLADLFGDHNPKRS